MIANIPDSMIISYCKEDDVYVNEQGRKVDISAIKINGIFEYKKRKYIITKVEHCENQEIMGLARITRKKGN